MGRNLIAAAPHQQAASVRAEKIRKGMRICIAFEQQSTDQSAGSAG
jgi:hypothetical protein